MSDPYPNEENVDTEPRTFACAACKTVQFTVPAGWELRGDAACCSCGLGQAWDPEERHESGLFVRVPYDQGAGVAGWPPGGVAAQAAQSAQGGRPQC